MTELLQRWNLEDRNIAEGSIRVEGGREWKIVVVVISLESRMLVGSEIPSFGSTESLFEATYFNTNLGIVQMFPTHNFSEPGLVLLTVRNQE